MDELAEIGGCKPKRLLADGEKVSVNSMTSSSVYEVKRVFDHYYCKCPAWAMQGNAPVNARSCKHLRQLLGDDYENARLLWKNPHGSPSKAPKAKKTKSTSKGLTRSNKAAGKRKNRDEDDGDEEKDDDDDKPSSKKIKRMDSPSKRRKDADDDEEEEEDSEATDKPKLLLANKWDLDNGADPTGWWASEKLDGVRVFFDGTKMISRLGNPFTPPQSFLDKLPKDITLDGELFGGRNKFQDTVSIVKTVNSPQWKDISFCIFDIPSMGDEPFEVRLEFLNKTFMKKAKRLPGAKIGLIGKIEQVEVVEQTLVRDRDHVLQMLKDVETLGGEGLMLRKPKSEYEGTRSSTLLKVKTFYDAEAKVEGYTSGKGKHAGKTGALKCVMESGKTFNVGSGLTDTQRAKPPPVGSIIVYRFQELSRDGVPRFPTFVGIAADKKRPKDAEVPPHRELRKDI